MLFLEIEHPVQEDTLAMVSRNSAGRRPSWLTHTVLYSPIEAGIARSKSSSTRQDPASTEPKGSGYRRSGKRSRVLPPSWANSGNLLKY